MLIPTALKKKKDFKDGVSLHRDNWLISLPKTACPGTHRSQPASASQVLKLKSYAPEIQWPKDIHSQNECHWVFG